MQSSMQRFYVGLTSPRSQFTDSHADILWGLTRLSLSRLQDLKTTLTWHMW